MDDRRAFVLELIEQHWCGPNPEMDPSAGGRLLVRINGATVPRGEEDDVSISRSDRWEWLGWQNELRETLDSISTLVD